MSELLAGLAALAPGVAIRASLLVAVGYGVASALGGRSAALRHLVWSVALGAAAAVPLLQMALPAVEVAILPASVSAPRPASNAPVALPAPGAPLPAAARVAGAPAPPRPEIVLAAVWLLGMLALSVRLAGGVLRVWWLERRAAEVTDDAWVRLTDTLSRRLKLGRIVTLLRAEPASVPMTWGVFRPVVALPAQSAGWDEERRTVVLAHELAHVRRWDALTQWVAHAAVVLHWYNPLVWMAAHRLREERERACDDAVLAIGARPSVYADHLLTLVQSLGRSEGPVAALAMARRSQFEGRLLAILDRANPRRGVSGVTLASALALAVAVAAPLSALRATQRSAADKGAPTSAARDTGDVAALLDGARVIESSDERARLLVGVLTQRRLSSADAVTLLQRAGEMSSGARIREVLVMALGRVPMGEGRVRDAYFRVAEGLESDAERRDVLVAVLAHAGGDGSLASAAFRATHSMSSDAERREVLVAGLRGRRMDAATRGAFMEALGTIDSDHERAAVLSALGGTGAAEKRPDTRPSAPWNSNSTHRHLEDDVEQYRTELSARQVRLNAARDDIAAIDPGGSLTLRETLAGGGSRSLTVAPSAAGALRYEYRVNGTARPFDAAARSWMRDRVRESAK